MKFTFCWKFYLHRLELNSGLSFALNVRALHAESLKIEEKRFPFAYVFKSRINQTKDDYGTTCGTSVKTTCTRYIKFPATGSFSLFLFLFYFLPQNGALCGRSGGGWVLLTSVYRRSSSKGREMQEVVVEGYDRGEKEKGAETYLERKGGSERKERRDRVGDRIRKK